MVENLDELMQQGKKKLEEQEDTTEEAVDAMGDGDIYAELRAEAEDGVEASTTEYPEDVDIKYQSNESYPDVSIEYQGEYPEDWHTGSDDIPLFNNGPSLSQVDIWKKQYSNESLYHVKVINKHFIFRTLNRYEYKQIVAIENVDALYREEVICRTCVLWPYNYDFKAMAKDDSGYPSTVAALIMEASGFTDSVDIEVL